ncbi:MAG: PDZ domain-containing protein [Planctomycetota bacterium]|nr:PDZ domain-containing protein [Planctomycetota bacterium]
MSFVRCCSASLWLAAVTIGFCFPWIQYFPVVNNDFGLQPHDQDVASVLVQEPSSSYSSYRLDYTLPSQSPNQRIHSPVLRTFEQVVGSSSDSTVQIISGGRQVSLGIVVDKDGWVLTKASQLSGDGLECRLADGTVVQAVRKSVRQDIDLALVRIEANDLLPISWHEENMVKVGGWLATLGSSKRPLSIGVVSVLPRTIRQERAILGIEFGFDRKGALIKMVLPGGGAAKAGIEDGDVIVAMDDQRLESQEAVLSKIGTLHAGQRVRIGLQRGERSLEVEAQLMDLHPSLLDETEIEVNGNLSARSTGFAKVFQHDTVLEPHQCGGPLVDTRGRVVGVNIARAGRVSSYALPNDVVIPAVRSMLSAAKSIPVSVEPTTRGK